jgi:hypothetical protein
LIESEKLFGGSSSKGINAFDTKERVMELNNVKIKAFPSHHLDTMCGLVHQMLQILYERIEKEAEDIWLYKRILLIILMAVDMQMIRNSETR